MSKNTIECDVLIMGASFAGNALARQLKLLDPSLKIAQFDRKTKYNSWIGESTVEAWEHYMIQNLQLGFYLEKSFLTKHGLRFFFDSKDKNLTMEELSEVGRSRYHGHASRQVDREKLDTDMVIMNKEMGVTVNLGETLEDSDNGIQIDFTNGHRIETDRNIYVCKYVVDACGMASPLSKKHKDRKIESRHFGASAWGKFVGSNDLDCLGPKEWKKRVNFTSRNNSTNHFMYDGYWIWVIPLDVNVHSIGVSWAAKYGKKSLKTPEKLDAFLREHKCLDQIMGKGHFQEFMSWSGFTAHSEKPFSEDGWFKTGMAAYFIDPMTSGGNRIAANLNTLICDVILEHRKGNMDVWKSKIKHFNHVQKLAYEGHFNNLTRFDWFGCYDIWSTYYDGIIHKYWNSTFVASASDFEYLKKVATDHAGGCECKLDISDESIRKDWSRTYGSAIYRLTEEMLQFVRDRDVYHRNNEGMYHDCGEVEERDCYAEKLFDGTNKLREYELDRINYKYVFKCYLQKMCEVDGVVFNEQIFDGLFENDWKKGQTLDEILQQMPSQAKMSA